MFLKLSALIDCVSNSSKSLVEVVESYYKKVK